MNFANHNNNNNNNNNKREKDLQKPMIIKKVETSPVL